MLKLFGQTDFGSVCFAIEGNDAKCLSESSLDSSGCVNGLQGSYHWTKGFDHIVTQSNGIWRFQGFYHWTTGIDRSVTHSNGIWPRPSAKKMQGLTYSTTRSLSWGRFFSSGWQTKLFKCYLDVQCCSAMLTWASIGEYVNYYINSHK